MSESSHKMKEKTPNQNLFTQIGPFLPSFLPSSLNEFYVNYVNLQLLKSNN